MSIYDRKIWTYENLIDPLKNFSVKGIAVKLSGGADSSVIYYKLCKEMSEKGLDYPLYVATLDPDTKDWYSHYAKKVIKFTKEKTGIEPVEHRIRKLVSPWGLDEYQKEQDDVLFDIFREGLANVYYGGLTKNPYHKQQARSASTVDGIKMNYTDCLEEAKAGADPDRQTNNNKFAIGYGKPDHVDVPLFLGIMPFVHKDKKEGTAAMYKELDIIDDLLPLTYSCEEHRSSEKTKLNVVNGYQEYSHCGRCWFCLERAYAFGRLV
jgi:hypothetical protein